MEHDFHYIGCFLDPEELAGKLDIPGRKPLACPIRCPHVTFAYRPKAVDRKLFGQRVTVTVTGYGCDGQNEGLRVTLCCADAGVMALAEKIPVPHITLSVSPDSQSVQTRYLDFAPIEPFTLTGVFGGFTTEGPITTRG